MKFQDIVQYVQPGSYEVNIPLDHLEISVQRYIDEYDLQLDPDFQRGHVWNDDQRTSFVEFFLRGGMTGRVIYFNHPTWMDFGKAAYNDMVIVDGLQRLTALRKFMAGEISAFGHTIDQYEDERGISMSRANFNLLFNINSIKTKRGVLEWYLQLNTGGVIHTSKEINKVKKLLDELDD